MAKLKPTIANTASKMANYNFDTSTYIVLGSLKTNIAAGKSTTTNKFIASHSKKPHKR